MKSTLENLARDLETRADDTENGDARYAWEAAADLTLCYLPSVERRAQVGDSAPGSELLHALHANQAHCASDEECEAWDQAIRVVEGTLRHG